MSSLVTELNNLTLSATSNQLRVGNPDANGSVTTISVSAPSAARTLTVPDPGVSCNVQLGAIPVVALTTTATLTAAQSGSIVSLSTATANPSVVTLPAAAAGINFRFKSASHSLSNAFQIRAAAAAAIVGGTLIVNAAKVAITFGTSVGPNFTTSCTEGDWVDVVSDGTNYYVSGCGQASGSMTVT